MIRWQAVKGFLKGCRSLRNNESWDKLRTHRYNFTPARFKSAASDIQCFTEEGLMACYNHEQQQMVLKALNAASVEVLRQLAVTKQRAVSLVRQREKKGDFYKLEDIFEVEHFGIKSIQNLCDNIVYGNSEDAKKQAASLWQQISNPSTSQELRNTLKSVVSLNLDPQRLVWLHLGRDMDVFDWDQTRINDLAKGYNHKHNLALAHELFQKLPDADAYIMERRKVTGKQATSVSSMLGIYQLESMLTALLSKDFADTKQHRVFTVKDSVVGRFFDLKIGTEVVSSQEMVAKILSGVHCDKIRKVKCRPDTQSWYDGQPAHVKEELASCLLQAIAFYELEIVRNKVSVNV